MHICISTLFQIHLHYRLLQNIEYSSCAMQLSPCWLSVLHIVVYICLSLKYMKMKVLLSHIWLFLIPQTVVHQAPLSVEFSRQEYWSRLPFPPPGDLPDPGTEPRSPALRADSVMSEPPGKPKLPQTLPLTPWDIILFYYPPPHHTYYPRLHTYPRGI